MLDIIRSVLLNINVQLCFLNAVFVLRMCLIEEVPGFSNTHRSIFTSSPHANTNRVLLSREALLLKDNQLNGCLLLLSLCNRLCDCNF